METVTGNTCGRKTAAIVLAAGNGKRMKTAQAKQYLDLVGKPVLFYALSAFEESSVDSIILVTGEEDIQYCRENIVEKYGFRKVRHIVSGGKERYHSVYCGLQVIPEYDYVLIHDGARPFITVELIQDMVDAAIDYKACAAAVPVKDTIKIADEENYFVSTPKRSLLFSVQTPQAFDYPLIMGAYDRLMKEEKDVLDKGILITDDTMVVENFTDIRVKMVPGSYRNIKITTPEDLQIASDFLLKTR